MAAMDACEALAGLGYKRALVNLEVKGVLARGMAIGLDIRGVPFGPEAWGMQVRPKT